MTRLTELSGTGTGSTTERWGQRFVDALGRWSGLRTFAVALRRRLQHRRTLKALTQLDDRLLRDIGVSRADIEATVAFCCAGEAEETPSVWQRLGRWLSRERRRRQTVRELSAMPDAILADVGIERGEIPAVAAVLAEGQPVPAATGASVQGASERALTAPVTAEVLAFVEARRSLQRHANQNVSRPAA